MVCILGLMLLGLFCGPVAAEGLGFWTFGIMNDAGGHNQIYVEGRTISAFDTTCDKDDPNPYFCFKRYFEVNVSDDIDAVNVDFVVNAGRTTSVTITKEYITQLRTWGEDHGFGDEPILVARGGTLTYDVDAGVLKRTRDPVTGEISALAFTPHEHLKEWGAGHYALDKSKNLNLQDWVRLKYAPDNFSLPITPGRAGFWTFTLEDKIVGEYSVDIWGVDEIKGNYGTDVSSYQEINVPDPVKKIDVKFNVNGGKSTRVTITKNYITQLRTWGEDHGFGDEPILVARGCIDTYDVDAGVLKRTQDSAAPKGTVFTFTPHDHLKERGFGHWSLSESNDVTGWDDLRALPYPRYVPAP